MLLAVCDAKYCFTILEIGAQGGSNDAAALSSSTFRTIFKNNQTLLNIPETSLVGNTNLPYVLVGDDIFQIKPWLMKPFPGNGLLELERIYNYRLSRARRVIESAFGIMSTKWRILRRPIKAGIDQVEGIVKA